MSDYSDLFRETLGQSLEEPKPEKAESRRVRPDTSIFKPREVEVPTVRRNALGDKYQAFLAKYEDLERFIDGFTPQDLMYYFREKARESGVKYHISNMKRDMGIFKKLLEEYTTREIALMIEFIFSEEQNYLTTEVVQPTVLASGMVNRIYKDSKAWANDEYVPREVKSRTTSIKKREWKHKPEKERTKIGEW